MLLDAAKSVLLLVDVQEKLTPHIVEHKKLITRCEWLLQVATQLAITKVVSEQYPQGLGGTLPVLKQAAEPVALYLEKKHFSCVADTSCWQAMQQLHKQQWILIGIEAHVCVLQTALDLRSYNQEVFVVADAIGSRSHEDKTLAIERMRMNGVHIVTREMVLFEWLHQAGTDVFKKISQQFLKS
ncbi:MAG: isochorismatase family protein [Gammaproteobacteria bacterium]